MYTYTKYTKERGGRKREREKNTFKYKYFFHYFVAQNLFV